MEMFAGEVTWLAGQAAPHALRGHRKPGRADPSIPPMPAEVKRLLNRKGFRKRPQSRAKQMQEIVAELQRIYLQCVGRRYPRELPDPAVMVTDSLNNRAVSFYDLGKLEAAKDLWQQALQADPRHLETSYNVAMMQLRQSEGKFGRLVEAVTCVQCASSAAEPAYRPQYLEAQVRMAAFMLKSAEQCLVNAVQFPDAGADVWLALGKARLAFGKHRTAEAAFAEAQRRALEREDIAQHLQSTRVLTTRWSGHLVSVRSRVMLTMRRFLQKLDDVPIWGLFLILGVPGCFALIYISALFTPWIL